jgi:peptidoglycan LD-endopeptidase CwlK
MSLTGRCRERLQGVHPDLVRVVERAAEGGVSFRVIEGVRTQARQAVLVTAGASRTMKSRHLTGHAVDLAVVVDGEVRWDWPMYRLLAMTVKAAASELGIPVEWGGDWETFKDGPHWQLPRSAYADDWLAPAGGEVNHA